jgi:tetratricopeptide (TPR) repeat protein
MQPAVIVLFSALVSAGAAAGVSFALRPAEAPSLQPSIAEVQQSLAKLTDQQQALQQRLDSLAKAPAVGSAPVDASLRSAAAPSDEQVAAAVDAYLQRRAQAAAAGSGAPAVAADGKPTFDLDTDFAALLGNSYWDNPEAWKKAFAAGRIGEVVAKFEALAKAAPNDTKVQMDLANAYLAHYQMDQSKWQLSMKADKVFDKVLALDDKHWEARFTKAMSYTFYPDFLGKKKESIEHFELLVQQQDSMPVEASQAQTYLYLGNLLEARDPQKAREVWQKGARRHPENADLQKRAGN